MAKKGDRGVFNISVIGMSGVMKEQASGVGKSCLCNRFLRPLADQYYDDHISVVSQSDFGSRVINNVHFLYWGGAMKSTDDNGEFSFHIVEQTEFIDDQQYKELRGGNTVPYNKRCAATKLVSEEKLMYICKDQLALEQEFEQVPLPDGKMSIDGFLCVIDVSHQAWVSYNRSFAMQLTFIDSIIVQVSKTKKPLLFAFTKCDDLSDANYREAEKFAQKRSIQWVETSAKEATNVDLAFLMLATMIDKSRGRFKVVPFAEASRTRTEFIELVTEGYKKLLKSTVTLYDATWFTCKGSLELELAFLEFVSQQGMTLARRLFNKHVQKLWDKRYETRLKGFISRLPKILSDVFTDSSAIADKDWKQCQAVLLEHPESKTWFINLGEDPWSESDHFHTEDPRIPVDILDSEKTAECCFVAHVSKLKAAEHKARMKIAFQALLNETPQITPGKNWNEVHIFLVEQPPYKALLENERVDIYREHQRIISEKAKEDFQELLSEHPELFSRLDPDKEVLPSEVKEIHEALRDEIRYRALNRREDDRQILICKHIAFLRHPTPDSCLSHEMCMDKQISQTILNEAKRSRPISWSVNNHWEQEASGTHFNISCIGDRTLAVELADAIKDQCVDEDYTLDEVLYCLDVRPVSGDVNLVISNVRMRDFSPHACFCAFSCENSFNYINECLDRLLLNRECAGRSLLFHNVCFVIVLNNDANRSAEDTNQLRELGQQLADRVHCHFVDIVPLEAELMTGGCQGYTEHQIEKAMRFVVSNARQQSERRSHTNSLYESVDIVEPDLRLMFCTFCDDPYSLDIVLAPLINYHGCWTPPGNTNSLLMEMFLGFTKRKVQVQVLSYHAARTQLDQLQHGYILVYSAKRKASLETLRSFTKIMHGTPIQIIAVTEGSGSNAYFTDNTSHGLINEGNNIADHMKAKFMIATAADFKLQTAVYTPFFKEAWDKKFNTEQMFRLHQHRRYNGRIDINKRPPIMPPTPPVAPPTVPKSPKVEPRCRHQSTGSDQTEPEYDDPLAPPVNEDGYEEDDEGSDIDGSSNSLHSDPGPMCKNDVETEHLIRPSDLRHMRNAGFSEIVARKSRDYDQYDEPIDTRRRLSSGARKFAEDPGLSVYKPPGTRSSSLTPSETSWSAFRAAETNPVPLLPSPTVRKKGSGSPWVARRLAGAGSLASIAPDFKNFFKDMFHIDNKIGGDDDDVGKSSDSDSADTAGRKPRKPSKLTSKFKTKIGLLLESELSNSTSTVNESSQDTSDVKLNGHSRPGYRKLSNSAASVERAAMFKRKAAGRKLSRSHQSMVAEDSDDEIAPLEAGEPLDRGPPFPSQISKSHHDLRKTLPSGIKHQDKESLFSFSRTLPRLLHSKKHSFFSSKKDLAPDPPPPRRPPQTDPPTKRHVSPLVEKDPPPPPRRLLDDDLTPTSKPFLSPRLSSRLFKFDRKSESRPIDIVRKEGAKWSPRVPDRLTHKSFAGRDAEHSPAVLRCSTLKIDHTRPVDIPPPLPPKTYKFLKIPFIKFRSWRPQKEPDKKPGPTESYYAVPPAVPAPRVPTKPEEKTTSTPALKRGAASRVSGSKPNCPGGKRESIYENLKVKCSLLNISSSKQLPVSAAAGGGVQGNSSKTGKGEKSLTPVAEVGGTVAGVTTPFGLVARPNNTGMNYVQSHSVTVKRKVNNPTHARSASFDAVDSKSPLNKTHRKMSVPLIPEVPKPSAPIYETVLPSRGELAQGAKTGRAKPPEPNKFVLPLEDDARDVQNGFKHPEKLPISDIKLPAGYDDPRRGCGVPPDPGVAAPSVVSKPPPIGRRSTLPIIQPDDATRRPPPPVPSLTHHRDSSPSITRYTSRTTDEGIYSKIEFKPMMLQLPGNQVDIKITNVPTESSKHPTESSSAPPPPKECCDSFDEVFQSGGTEPIYETVTPTTSSPKPSPPYSDAPLSPKIRDNLMEHGFLTPLAVSTAITYKGLLLDVSPSSFLGGSSASSRSTPLSSVSGVSTGYLSQDDDTDVWQLRKSPSTVKVYSDEPGSLRTSMDDSLYETIGSMSSKGKPPPPTKPKPQLKPKPGKLDMSKYSNVRTAIHIGPPKAPLATPENLDNEYSSVKDAIPSPTDGIYETVHDVAKKHKIRNSRKKKEKKRAESDGDIQEGTYSTPISRRARGKPPLKPIAPAHDSDPDDPPPLPAVTNERHIYMSSNKVLQRNNSGSEESNGTSEEKLDESRPRKRYFKHMAATAYFSDTDIRDPTYACIADDESSYAELQNSSHEHFEQTKAKNKELKEQERRRKDEEKRKQKEERRKKKGGISRMMNRGKGATPSGGRAPGLSSLPVGYFRTPLEELVTIDNEIPSFLKKTTEFLEEEGLKAEGLYRVPGNKADSELLMLKFDEDHDVDIHDLNIGVNAVATAVKSFFSELPEPLVPSAFHTSLTEAIAIHDKKERLDKLIELVGELPTVNYLVLKTFMLHLNRVSMYSEENLMTPDNLAICFWPTLMRPEIHTVEKMATMIEEFKSVMMILVEQCSYIFYGSDEIV